MNLIIISTVSKGQMPTTSKKMWYIHSKTQLSIKRYGTDKCYKKSSSQKHVNWKKTNIQQSAWYIFT